MFFEVVASILRVCWVQVVTVVSKVIVGIACVGVVVGGVGVVAVAVAGGSGGHSFWNEVVWKIITTVEFGVDSAVVAGIIAVGVGRSNNRIYVGLFRFSQLLLLSSVGGFDVA